MFIEEREESLFTWDSLGNVALGRPNLGQETSVAVYRLMQFTIRDVIIKKIGVEETDKLFYEAGKIAGQHYYRNIITQKNDFNSFLADVKQTMLDLKIGILRVEEANFQDDEFIITIAEDLDCSGIPICNEEICTYDEGFLAGIMVEHTNKEYLVKEIDCWCSGARVCKFLIKGLS